MEYDAFSGGLAPGGLRNKDEIKILICYLLHQVDRPLKKELVIEALLYDGLANYFEVGEAIYDLVRRENIVSKIIGDEETLSLTPNGQNIALRLERDLPRSVREKAVKTALRMLTRERNERENRVSISSGENGISVTCTVLDGEAELMKLSLLVGDKLQADQVKNAFYDQPGLLYAAVISTLTGDQSMLRKMLNDRLPEGYTDYLNE